MKKNDKSLKKFSAIDRQKETYIGGMSGQIPAIPFDLQKLEAKAKSVMSKEAFSYVLPPLPILVFATLVFLASVDACGKCFRVASPLLKCAENLRGW